MSTESKGQNRVATPRQVVGGATKARQRQKRRMTKSGFCPLATRSGLRHTSEAALRSSEAALRSREDPEISPEAAVFRPENQKTTAIHDHRSSDQILHVRLIRAQKVTIRDPKNCGPTGEERWSDGGAVVAEYGGVGLPVMEGRRHSQCLARVWKSPSLAHGLAPEIPEVERDVETDIKLGMHFGK
ncbi:hypothetical protein U1Q18_014040 [Sarracenia purpurea var. burkii]